MVRPDETQYRFSDFYYDDIHAVVPVHENMLGFELVLDQGLAHMYRIAGKCYFGIVDGNRGHLKHQQKSATLPTVVAPDVEGRQVIQSKSSISITRM